MKQFWREVGLAVVLGMLMPGLILNIVTYSAHRHVSGTDLPVNTDPVSEGVRISVITGSGIMKEMELESYLIGVVLAEMPASFENEALKAQAVVARTYALRADGKRSKHADAAVCTDSGCCQAYISPDDYRYGGGDDKSIGKVRRAVEATSGQVLTFEGELIEATYFSCSGGQTEDAIAVWGTDIPYLRSVPSPGEEAAAHYTDSFTFSNAQVRELLNLPKEDKELRIENVIHTAGGGVAELTICGITFQGTEIRKILGLCSTAFSITADNDEVTFHTRGFGHRVGMSQYGAEAMALNGSNYRDILTYYYPGTILENRSIDKPASVG